MSGIPDAKSSEKLRVLMADTELSPSVQEKLKVAFAEGYMAHTAKPGSSSMWRWLRYILTSVFIMTVALLIFNILITTATGGKLYCAGHDLFADCIFSSYFSVCENWYTWDILIITLLNIQNAVLLQTLACIYLHCHSWSSISFTLKWLVIVIILYLQ